MTKPNRFSSTTQLKIHTKMTTIMYFLNYFYSILHLTSNLFYIKVPKWYEDKFADIENEFRRKIIAMTYLLDESVANITRDLERNNMLDDTIIIFSSDVLKIKESILNNLYLKNISVHI